MMLKSETHKSYLVDQIMQRLEGIDHPFHIVVPKIPAIISLNTKGSSSREDHTIGTLLLDLHAKVHAKELQHE